MPWTVAEGPHNAGWSGRDAVGWVWILTNEQGARHPLAVWVSGTAMAVSPEFLPPETARARETLGRSEPIACRSDRSDRGDAWHDMRSTTLDEIAGEQEVRLTARLLREALGAAWL